MQHEPDGPLPRPGPASYHRRKVGLEGRPREEDIGCRRVARCPGSGLECDGLWPRASQPREPAAGAELSVIPLSVCLWFSEPVEKALSRIEVKDAQGNRVDDLDRWRASEESKGTGEVLWMPLKPIGPGEYTVSWRVLSVDTHSTQGEYRFVVLPGAEAADAAESEGSAQVRCDVPVS